VECSRGGREVLHRPLILCRLDRAAKAIDAEEDDAQTTHSTSMWDGRRGGAARGRRHGGRADGTRFHFEGVRGTTRQTDDQVVLRRTKRILGVTCTVVRDTVSEHGRAVERTDDWYAQDRQGNVWYMGETRSSARTGASSRPATRGSRA
jgi:hypothetical protein